MDILEWVTHIGDLVLVLAVPLYTAALLLRLRVSDQKALDQNNTSGKIEASSLPPYTLHI